MKTHLFLYSVIERCYNDQQRFVKHLYVSIPILLSILHHKTPKNKISSSSFLLLSIYSMQHSNKVISCIFEKNLNIYFTRQLYFNSTFFWLEGNDNMNSKNSGKATASVMS
ncbi:hypothetical protein ACKWTF_000382 [Chironomus riparius]